MDWQSLGRHSGAWFPIRIVARAWVFDASNQGAITANGDSPAENSGKRIDTAIIIVLATALGTTFVFYDRDSPNTNAARADAEIAQQQPTRKPAMAPSAASNYLLIGNLVDFTGATGRSGQARGGKPLLIARTGLMKTAVLRENFSIWTQSKHRTSCVRALPAYEKWLTQDVLAIQGFGTNIGLALRDKVAANEIPYFSSAMAASFTAPNGSPGVATPAPYSFIYGPSYSDACRGLLEWAKDDWQSKELPGAPSYAHG